MYPSVKAAGDEAAAREAGKIRDERELAEHVRIERGEHGDLSPAPFSDFGHADLAEMRAKKPDLFGAMLADSKAFRDRVDALDAERADVEERIAEARDRAVVNAPPPSRVEVLDGDFAESRAAFLARFGVDSEKKLHAIDAERFNRELRLPYLAAKKAAAEEALAMKEHDGQG